MQRLYFLTPDPQTTVTIANELNDLGLRRSEVHIMARDRRQLNDTGLREATLLQTSDAVNASKRGLLIGIPLGLVVGIAAATVLSIPGQAGNFALVIGLGIFGGLFGLWASTLVGVSVPDIKVEKFQHAYKRGAILMMVDVPGAREKEISDTIRRHHPDVEIEKITEEERRHAEGQGN
ncbi:hypothetical protein SAMN02745148_02613 [Modicisalibacter ilicicola DSM 19980]|uniref:DUF1269 domain-containing protein n=1 Tax=Modicisalibacter ilicicola DSM 19980 TaxID=1121942 RepID=A0A1M5BJM1_9GAMM|nr:DUF1269 domain-containing protein [Halomonas ilicicola]SHF42731.1 hypothetical protein SAMN02745148_02613 [Halomonas ilicicola DSM 19980]